MLKRLTARNSYQTHNPINKFRTKSYILPIVSYLILVYALFFILDPALVHFIYSEDSIIEYLTFALFIAASVFFIKVYRVKKNVFYLLLGLVFIVGAGEEISWGQRIFSFATPESLNEINVQREFNMHNIEIFNGLDFEGNPKEGLSKLLSINFLYKLFWLFFGVVLPVMVLFSKKGTEFIQKIKLPLPPLSIGIFFLINWIVCKSVISYLYSPEINYPLRVNLIFEAMESGSALIFFVIAFYFYKSEKRQISKTS